MIKSIKGQMKIILSRKTPWIIFMVLLGFAITNVLQNVFHYEGSNVMKMIHPMRLLLLSSDGVDAGTIGFYFLQLFPLLVVIPAGFSFYDDKHSKEEIYLSLSLGKTKYILGKIISVFLVTCFIFMLPLLIEYALNCLSFPLEANGNMGMHGVYDLGYTESVRSYMFTEAFLISPYLYSFITILIFGCVAGILGAFSVAISFVFSRFKVLLLLPVYVLLYGVGMISSILGEGNVHTSHFDYLSMFDISYKSEISYFILLGFIIGVTSVLTYIKVKKDVI